MGCDAVFRMYTAWSLNATLDAKKIITLRQISEFSSVFSSPLSKFFKNRNVKVLYRTFDCFSDMAVILRP